MTHPPPKNIFSNSIEVLYQKLKSQLFDSSPFAKRLIVVPSPAMKSWLMMQLAKDPDTSIAMGLEILYLEPSIHKIQTFTKSYNLNKSLNGLELSLIIEQTIRQILLNHTQIDPQQMAVWRPLLKYFNISTQAGSLTRKQQKRLIGLAETLSGLFLKYGKYAAKIVSKWSQNPTDNWQISLWQKIFSTCEYPYQFLNDTLQQPISSIRSDVQIHLFAISHIPELYFQYLLQIADKISLFVYTLSPCKVFWSDLSSEKEAHYLLSSFAEQTEAMETYFRDHNSLLTNLGKLGQKLARQIEESGMVTEECYVAPHFLLESEVYRECDLEEIAWIPSAGSLQMLAALQADWLLLRNPETSLKVAIEPTDRSIQIHAAPNRLREVQILYHNLVDLIHKHAQEEETILPGNILVMCPDLHTYTPYIEAVFNQKESLLKAHIHDRSALLSYDSLQGFMHLLSLPLSRWEASAIKRLFDFPSFQKRHQLTHEEIALMKDWIKKTEVRWGMNVGHRNEILKRDHCRHQMVEDSPTGTWEHALERMLLGLITDPSETEILNDHLEEVPFNLDFSQEQLLGKWIELLQSIQQDLKPLHEDRPKPLNEWSKYLSTLYQVYFASESENEIEALGILGHFFEQLQKAEYKLGGNLIHFSTIHHHLKNHLEKQIENYREGDPNAIKFCAMLPMRAIPAQVICLIGLNEKAYPRYDLPSSLNLISNFSDYCPSPTDYDRYLFLEAILSARKYFIGSYCYTSAEDGALQPPSLLFTELLSYADQAFETEDKKPSEQIYFQHPFHAFDKTYFTKNSRFVNSSMHDYRAAQAYYKGSTCLENHSSDLDTQTENQAGDLEKTISVSVQQLAAFAKNPVKSFFNQTLGIYLNRAEDQVLKNEEEFQLSPLQSFAMKQAIFKKPVAQILKHAEKAGRLPIGPFKQFSIDRFIHETDLLKQHLTELQAAPSNLYSMEISNRYETAARDVEGNWQLPPLLIPVGEKQIQLSGMIYEVSDKGLVTRFKDDLTDAAKIWPEYLIFCCLIEQHQLAISKDILFIHNKKHGKKESFFETARPLLIKYLEHYLESMQRLFPLLPEWVPDLIKQEEQIAYNKIESSLANPFQPFYNEYFKWVYRNGSDTMLILRDLKPKAEQLFSQMYKNWYAKD